jgi:glycosyltransferase involved in cell wall biosynthesis
MGKHQKTVRVLHFICPTGLHGAERWILALARNLDPRRTESQLAVTHEFQGQNLEVRDMFAVLGKKAHTVPMRGRFDIGGIRELVRIIREEKIDVVHTHGYKSDIMGLLAARLAQVKALSTPHGFENSSDMKLRLFIALGCFSLRFFDQVAPLSDGLYNDIRGVGISPSKIRLITNGVDMLEIDKALRSSISPFFPENDRKRIGFVGQLICRKNLGDMIDAFDRLWRKDPSVDLIIIGDGDRRPELEKFVRSLPCRPSVYFMGYRKDRLRIVREFDIFSMTSSLEGIPRCIMEAMGLGIPVVAFDIPGVDRVVDSGKTGFLVPFGDVNALSDAWTDLLKNPRKREAMGQQGRRLILHSFSAKRMAKEYEKLYQEMLGLKSKTGSTHNPKFS